MSQNQYSPAALCALINSGAIRLPLSHTRSLEVIAHLEGAKDWNTIAHREDAELLKARARALRSSIDDSPGVPPLGEAAAIAAIEKVLQAVASTPGAKTAPLPASEPAPEPLFNFPPLTMVWPEGDEVLSLALQGGNAEVHKDFVTFGSVTMLQLSRAAVIAAPMGRKFSTRFNAAWCKDYATLTGSLIDLGVIPFLGAPSELNARAPFSLKGTDAEYRCNLAIDLLRHGSAYTAVVRSDLAETYSVYAAVLERIAKDRATEELAHFLTEYNRDNIHSIARTMNFAVNRDNRTAGRALAALARKHGLDDLIGSLAVDSSEKNSMRFPAR